jgi:hypothetical protein
MEANNGLLPVKPNWINHYVRGERLTTTKDGLESFDNEINNYFTLAQMVFYTKNSGHSN